MTKIISIIALVMAGFSSVSAWGSSSDYWTAYNYVVRFYPRWMSALQFSGDIPGTMLTGPATVTPKYGIVVAINVDTLYASRFLDFSSGPLIFTLPPYENHYSILQTDVFGDVYTTNLSPSATGGVYALIGPKYKGPVPDGVEPIRMPLDHMNFIVRADKYQDNVDVTEDAEKFRRNIQVQTLAGWQKDPHAGKTLILPEETYAYPMKRSSDETILTSTTQYLIELQQAMALNSTEPLKSGDKSLMNKFNARFKVALRSSSRSGDALTDMTNGAVAAHHALIDRWTSHVGPTNWVFFDNIGHWGKSYLDRAALSEYIQWGNDLTAAYYAQAFVDQNGASLDGSKFSYLLHFTKNQIPMAQRFWSITGYTPIDVELIPNSLNKYEIASFTPGLTYDADGGLTLVFSATQPVGVPTANWLPVPSGNFNLMLRAYGPEGATADGTYVPPAIVATPIPVQ